MMPIEVMGKEVKIEWHSLNESIEAQRVAKEIKELIKSGCKWVER